MKRVLITGLLLTMSFSAQAAENPVQGIPSLPRICSSTPYGETCLHAFGGAQTRIPLPAERVRECTGVKAQLYQLSTRLAAPVGAPVALPAKDCSSIVLFLPAVREKTVFRISLLKPDGVDAMTNDTLVQVYPNDLWEPLKDWSRANHLVLNDRDNRLKPVLEQQHIAYSPIIMPPYDEEKKQVCIWVPREDSPDEDAPPFDCASLLVLHEKSEGLNYIHERTTAHQQRTDVYMPIIGALDANPLVQSTFINLIQSQL